MDNSILVNEFEDKIICRFASFELVRGEWRRYVNSLIDTESEPSNNTSFDIDSKIIGIDNYNLGKYKDAVEIFDNMSTSDKFEDFLTLPAYELL